MRFSKKMIKILEMEADVYCLCIRNDANCLMEILSVKEMFREHHKKIDYLVIGMAESKREAFALAAEMIQTHIESGEDLSSFKENYREAEA